MVPSRADPRQEADSSLAMAQGKLGMGLGRLAEEQSRSEAPAAVEQNMLEEECSVALPKLGGQLAARRLGEQSSKLPPPSENHLRSASMFLWVLLLVLLEQQVQLGVQR
mmetsp:Transcript_38848/g.91427  ORF Transcript_38848/g.91427 Transcript_38848/m.91427 type:complete len:109 (-) Transcript_38848:1787-2113(-)